MKPIIIFIAFFCLLSCTKVKQNQPATNSNSNLQLNSQNDSIINIDGRLKFINKFVYVNTLNSLYSMSLTELDNWENNFAFTSIRKLTLNDMDGNSCPIHDKYFASILNSNYLVQIDEDVFKIDPNDSFYYVLKDFNINSSHLTDLINQQTIPNVIFKYSVNFPYFEVENDSTGLFKTNRTNACNDPETLLFPSGRQGPTFRVNGSDTIIASFVQYSKWGIWFSVRNLIQMGKMDKNTFVPLIPNYDWGFENTNLQFTPVCKNMDINTHGRDHSKRGWNDYHPYYRVRRLKLNSNTDTYFVSEKSKGFVNTFSNAFSKTF